MIKTDRDLVCYTDFITDSYSSCRNYRNKKIKNNSALSFTSRPWTCFYGNIRNTKTDQCAAVMWMIINSSLHQFCSIFPCEILTEKIKGTRFVTVLYIKQKYEEVACCRLGLHNTQMGEVGAFQYKELYIFFTYEFKKPYSHWQWFIPFPVAMWPLDINGLHIYDHKWDLLLKIGWQLRFTLRCQPILDNNEFLFLLNTEYSVSMLTASYNEQAYAIFTPIGSCCITYCSFA